MICKQKQKPSSLTVSTCYERIEAREATVGAFQFLKPFQQAEKELSEAPSGPLRGMPIGVKDNYDTVDMPTQWGTSYLKSSYSSTDASLVAALRNAGGILIGKTVSTELAYFTPGKTRNPHDLKRTPGASSSGSAAAVADGMLRAAIGTQTAGSIIRPASFCGILGFKPSSELIPVSGAKPFSKSLDTVGWFARDMEDCIRLFNATTRRHDCSLHPLPLSRLRANILSNIEGIPLNDDAAALLELSYLNLSKILQSTVKLEQSQLFHDLISCQKTIMAYEASRTLLHEFGKYQSQMGQELLDILRQGEAIDLPEYLAALSFRDQARINLSNTFFHNADFLIAPSTIGEATEGLDTTGDPVYCRPWTLLGLPCLHLPIGLSDNGLPIGVQLVGKHREDITLLKIAAAITQLDNFTLTCISGE